MGEQVRPACGGWAGAGSVQVVGGVGGGDLAQLHGGGADQPVAGGGLDQLGAAGEHHEAERGVAEGLEGGRAQLRGHLIEPVEDQGHRVSHVEQRGGFGATAAALEQRVLGDQPGGQPVAHRAGGGVPAVGGEQDRDRAPGPGGVVELVAVLQGVEQEQDRGAALARAGGADHDDPARGQAAVQGVQFAAPTTGVQVCLGAGSVSGQWPECRWRVGCAERRHHRARHIQGAE